MDEEMQITKNLINAVVAYGTTFAWTDGEIFEALSYDFGITQQDFEELGYANFAEHFIEYL